MLIRGVLYFFPQTLLSLIISHLAHYTFTWELVDLVYVFCLLWSNGKIHPYIEKHGCKMWTSKIVNTFIYVKGMVTFTILSNEFGRNCSLFMALVMSGRSKYRVVAGWAALVEVCHKKKKNWWGMIVSLLKPFTN